MIRVLQFLINDDPRLTLTYFTARSKAWNVIGSCMCNLAVTGQAVVGQMFANGGYMHFIACGEEPTASYDQIWEKNI